MSMGSRKDLFFKDLIIDEEDKPLAERYLASKGVEKHIILKEKLFNWIEGNKIEYSMIASTYRYDKRLRQILFKYISYLEEFYRAVILDKYRNNPSEIEWVKDIADNLRKYKGDLNDALEHIEFSSLLMQVRRLPVELQQECHVPNEHARRNCVAISNLRNAVMHNKFLLLYRGFAICYVDGVDGGKSANLKANIINLMNFLPDEVADRCRQEINKANKDEEPHEGTKWNLPPVVKIELTKDLFMGKIIIK